MSAGETAIRAGNTVAWYDYTDATTLTNDGAGLISSWRDKLGSGHDLAAATTARPTLGATGITFDGITNGMATAAFTYIQPAMSYVVIKQITWTANDRIHSGYNPDTFLLSQRGTTPGITIYAGSYLGINNNLAVGAWGIVRSVFSGLASSIQVNVTTAVTGSAGTGAIGGIILGRNGYNGVTYCNFEIKEAIFRNVVDSTETQSEIYDYLKAKFGL